MRDVKEPEVRRTEIMEAALRLFSEKGYLKTTTQDIIDEVKISRGLLYYHFKDKEDILYCLVERYSEPLLQRLSTIAYNEKTAIEKVRAFVEATLISPNTVTANMMALQKTVDLHKNRYLMDRFAHKVSGIVTEYFAHIIEQGISEGVFHVTYPLETASFLMHGYVFVSNDVNSLDVDQQKQYVAAYKDLLECSLNANSDIFNN
ncbi:TetR/AcrR family transcriptional regulator [Fusibacter ferrireducens]|uniref:TetR/AcrR family transcriptional regulator n=1 Tax=Fusibacter ferrireducens TaxID=2785058 RepID=A0ABR9ZP07_9FIRM|nr:TetR/AcrR family transcriptional regulator [Fusibacter ferrireducens]MBF4692202.1 TetR/AcrR family transcriptional regulator [Fusibacter ferrireducens]